MEGCECGLETYEWKDIEYFDVSFDKRTAALIDLLDQDQRIESVLDIGCGLGFAKKYLRQIRGGNIKYTGLDYRRRDEETVICDLNKHEFVEQNYDLFIVAGCLEYVEDVEWFFKQFSRCKKSALISYRTMEYNSNFDVRKKNAWKNNLYRVDIISKMRDNGFFLNKEQLYKNKTVLFHFKRKECL